ncbi:MAG: hypothetical protein ACRBCK_04985 [Alphaproteobacteria bacterium]
MVIGNLEEFLYNEIEGYKHERTDSEGVDMTDSLAPLIIEALEAKARENEILLTVRRLKLKNPHVNYSRAAEELKQLHEKRSEYKPLPTDTFTEEFLEKLTNVLHEPKSETKKTPSLADKAFLQASVMGLYRRETAKAPIKMWTKMNTATTALNLMASFNDTTPKELLGFEPDEYIIPHNYVWW